MFPMQVEKVKKADPAKGDILEKGLADLQKASKDARPAKAKALLKELGLPEKAAK
jgi:transcriptional regulator of met regulon